jgi:hypothetical protein
MLAEPPPRISRLRGWLPLIAAAAVYVVTMICVVAWRNAGVRWEDSYESVRARTTSDFRDYWWTARYFREEGGITTQFGLHGYLPFFTILMTPWSFLPLPVAAALFAALSLGLAALSVVMAEMLLGGGLGPRPRWATLVALGLMLPYIHASAALLLVAGWFLIERGREWEAGAALGLATLLKLLPGLLIVFFLIKRRWRAAVAAAAVALVLGLGLPLISLGYHTTVTEHGALFDRLTLEHSAWATISAAQPRQAYYNNMGMPAVLRRLLTPLNAVPPEKGAPLYVNLANVPAGAIFGLYAALLAGVLAGSVAAALRRPVQHVETRNEAHRMRAQFGCWCGAMLLASPLLWVHYLPVAYWPLALVADRAERLHRARDPGRWWAAAALLAWLAGALLLAWPAARAAGAQLAALLVLWLAVLRFGLSRQT